MVNIFFFTKLRSTTVATVTKKARITIFFKNSNHTKTNESYIPVAFIKNRESGVFIVVKVNATSLFLATIPVVQFVVGNKDMFSSRLNFFGWYTPYLFFSF